jgi:hypothetical protein
MFYMASNISSLVNAKWFFGIPFNDSVNWRLTIAEESEQILGNNLLGLQAGNEPDFYVEYVLVMSPQFFICILNLQLRSPYRPLRPSRLRQRGILPHQ